MMEVSFQVVGDVGNQLRLETLALHLLVHRSGKPGGDVVQVLGLKAQVVGHTLGVDLILQVAAGDGLGALTQAVVAVGPPGQKQHQGQL